MCVEPIYVTIPDNATVDTSANEPGVADLWPFHFLLLASSAQYKETEDPFKKPLISGSTITRIDIETERDGSKNIGNIRNL